MNRWLLLVTGLYLSLATVALAVPQADITQAPKCHYCGMDREKYNHSRMLIEYTDNSKVGTCSLHCTAVELSTAIDKTPASLRVADFNTKELLDANQAIWVLDASKSGVMTARAKWAFSSREAADRYIQANGGVILSFDDAIKAAYEDMYQDTKAIRERREAKRSKQPAAATHQ